MNLQTHISRQTAEQVSNQAGNSSSVLLQENDNTEIYNSRRLILRKIYEFIMLKQQGRELPQKKIIDVVRRLEEGLFRTAASQEDYMNLDTLVARMHVLVKRSPFGSQNQQFVRSSSNSTTPGLPQNTIPSTPVVDNSHTGGPFLTSNADDHNIQEEFRQRISGGDEAQQSNLSAELAALHLDLET